MILYSETVKTAYEFLKQHDPTLANRLCDDIKFAAKRLQTAIDRKREREAEYNSSIWQRYLTRDVIYVLHTFERVIEDAQIRYYAYENDMLNAAEGVEKEIALRKESEIDTGNFVYYVVELDTNIRKTNEGIIVIYANRDSAEFDCEGYDTVISIAEYNRRYEAFMG